MAVGHMSTHMLIEFVVSPGVKEKAILFPEKYREAVGIISDNHHTAVKMYFITIGVGGKEGGGQFVCGENTLEQTLSPFGHDDGYLREQQLDFPGMWLKGPERYQACLRHIKMSTEVTEGVIMIAG
jgi:hypothetical protein